MDVAAATLRAQRYVLAGLMAVVPIAFWRPGTEVFQLPKASLVFVATVVLGCLAALRGIAQRQLVLPGWAALATVAGFCTAALLATVASESPMQSFVGASERYSGFASHLCYATLFILALQILDAHHVERGLNVVLASAAIVALYGLLQWWQLDPLEWRAAGPRVFSTQGNANFFSGYVAIMAPLAVTNGMLTTSRWIRWASWLMVVAFAALAIASSSSQGPIAMLPALAVPILVWLATGTNEDRSVLSRVGPARAIAVVGGLVVAFLAAVVRFGVIENASGGLETRRAFWYAALAIYRDHPLLGTGLDTFANFYSQYRNPDLDLDIQLVDSPHSVPVAMFVGGGTLLGLAYLAFVALIGVLAVRGLLRTGGRVRLLLGGLVGAWVGYQVQSFVSIDVPTHGLLHWMLAGAIIAVGAVDLRSLVIGRGPRRQRRGSAPAGVPATVRVAAGVLALIAIVGTWTALRPFRADAATAKATALARQGRANQSAPHSARAVQLAPWRGRHWFIHASALRVTGRGEEAKLAALKAARLEPGNFQYGLRAARLADELGDTATASRWYRHVLRIDPHNWQVLAGVTEWDSKHGRDRQAAARLRRELEVQPDSFILWMMLAKLERDHGHVDAAVAVYRRALAIDPTPIEALEYVKEHG